MNHKIHKNSIKQRIINEDLLIYKECVPSSGCNIDMVEELVGGAFYSKIVEKYHISSQRVQRIVADYIRHCYRYLKYQDINVS